MNWRDIRRFWCGPTHDDLKAITTDPLPEPPTDKADLASAATRLLADPMFLLALGRIEARLYESWKLSAPGDTEAREEHYRLYWAVGELRSELRRMIASARL